MMPASGVANMKHPCLLGVLALGLLHSSAVAQWMPHPVADMPRKSNGAPDLDAPVSRAADGKPDLSGLWYIRPFAKYHVNFAADFGKVPLTPSGESIYKRHLEKLGAEDPSTRCLPSGVPRFYADPFPFKILQRPGIVMMLLESGMLYRQIFTDGRELTANAAPTWLGYSVGQWSGDEFVIRSTGFNGKAWLDSNGLPTSDALRVTERLHRRDYGHMEVQITIDDAKIYATLWTVTLPLELMPESELMEFICLENEKDLRHIVAQ
jgi:hypothetical protein